MPPPSRLSVLLANVRSVLNKLDSFNSIVDTCRPNVIALTETWLNNNIRNTEIFYDASRYTIYRCDRTLRQGGGVMLAVLNAHDSYQVAVETDIEIILSCVEVAHQKFIFAACYRPPNAPPTFTASLHDVLNTVVTRLPSAPIFLLGDFNFPQIMWSSESPMFNSSSSQVSDFLNLCSTFTLTQLVTQPTRITDSTATVLDLVLTSRPDSVSCMTYLPGLSDHLILSFDISVPALETRKTTKQIRDYKKANFDAINTELSTFLDIFLDNFDNRTVEANWNLFLRKVDELTNKYIPLRKISSHARAPWYNAYLKRLSNRKKRLYRKAKLLPTNARWVAYKVANNSYVSAVKNAKSNFFQSTLPSLLLNNPQSFWRVINPSTTDSIKLLDHNDESIPDNECPVVLNRFFCSNFVVSSSTSLPSPKLHDYPLMNSIIIDTRGISKIIQSLKPSSSPGVDLITSKFLQGTASYSSILLTKLFQQSIDSGSLPIQWKIGKVVAVHKSGSKESPLNYRPISLTSIPCKVLEHVLYTSIVTFLESNSFFTDAQHGFRKGFSCETQLLSFTHQLHRILDRRSKADCIFLDFAKAFEKVSHNLLLLKLSKLNLDRDVFKWLEHFLCGRTQFVAANSYNSPECSVNSGVPQGSVLGPLLFLIYINDLTDCVSSNIHLFADDCVIFREINDTSDVSILQNDLNAISNWCSLWLMNLNIKKCKVLRVCRTSTTPASYHLNNVLLDCVSSYRYLGVHITSCLTWSVHISNIINNANRMLGYLRRNFSSSPASLKLLMYKNLVRSKLEYAASVWDPSMVYLIKALELVQNNSARFILHDYDRTASVTAMKNSLQLTSLSSRRKFFRLCLFHKIFHNSPHLRANLFLSPSYVSSRIDHAHKVGIPICQTRTCSESFVPRTSKDWNQLPGATAAITDYQLFRAALTNIVN